jgi:hypothetical protein
LSQRFALWSVTRGAGITTGGWAVMSGWTVITARLNIGWSVSKSSSPHVKLCANLPPAGFQTQVGNTEQTYPAVPIHTWEPFYVDSYAMQCHQRTSNNLYCLQILITLCIIEQIIVMTFLVQECYGSPKKHEFYRSTGEHLVNIRVEECFDKVLYHVNSQILKCKMKNVITMEQILPFKLAFLFLVGSSFLVSLQKLLL